MLKELWNYPDSSSADLLNMTCVSKPIKSAVHSRLVWTAVTCYVKSAILIRMHLRIVLAESVPHQARIPQCYKVLDVPEHLRWCFANGGRKKKGSRTLRLVNLQQQCQRLKLKRMDLRASIPSVGKEMCAKKMRLSMHHV